MRVFSDKWAAVSMPLPVKSKYPTSLELKTRNESMPFGEQLIKPLAESGAVATKNTRCSEIHALTSGVISSNSLPMPSPVAPNAAVQRRRDAACALALYA
jgi:hypothetical protein